MVQNNDKMMYPIQRLVLDSQANNNFIRTNNRLSSVYQINNGYESTAPQMSNKLFALFFFQGRTGITTLLIFFLLMLISFSSISQTAKPDTIYKRGFQIHPFQSQIGYRSNLDKKYFIDFKGGLSFTALPYFTLELNVLKRFVNKNQTKVYWGAGLSVDEYIFGLQFPLGIEFSPLLNNRQLTFIAELAPRLSYSNSYFVNIQFYPHIGACYYLKPKQKA